MTLIFLSTTPCVAPKLVGGQRVERRRVLCRAGQINPDIRKDEVKVVDTADVSTQEKPQVAYCRCWRSSTFPKCDGKHVKHNEETGDNVGPLLVKK
eukprot:jgi/Picsp_1/2268/NSC_05732-R1_protein